MIRPFERSDLDQVLEIWLDTNHRAHSFISASYWEGQLEAVRAALPQVELYVWEEAGEVLGFLGLEGEHIAGIFVRHKAQSRGMGRLLLDRAKAGRERLTLCVYQKNVRAAAFYRREGFTALRVQMDQFTGEAEYFMGWTLER